MNGQNMNGQTLSSCSLPIPYIITVQYVICSEPGLALGLGDVETLYSIHTKKF